MFYPTSLKESLQEKSFGKVIAGEIQMDSREREDFDRLKREYDYFQEDPHLFAGEGERYRSYARFIAEPGAPDLHLIEHQSFYQPKKFDVLYGDIERRFPPLSESLKENVFLHRLIMEDFAQFAPHLDQEETFEVSLHMIRIMATDKSSIGRPAPEGIHQDGYHFAAIHLIGRNNLMGAVNRIHDLDKKVIAETVLQNPMDSIFLLDRNVFHSVSPFETADPYLPSYRDILILLYQPLRESPQKLEPIVERSFQVEDFVSRKQFV